VAVTTATSKTVVAATAKVTGTHNNQKVTGTHNNQIIETAEELRRRRHQWWLRLQQQSTKI